MALPVGAYPFDLAFSPDGKWLATVGDDGTLTVLDTRTWTPLHESVEVHDGYGRQVEWLPDGETVVTSGSDGTVSLYDVTRDLVRVTGIPGSADGRTGQTHIFPPEGNEIVVSTEDGPGRRYPMDTDAWIDHACERGGTRPDRGRVEPVRAEPGVPPYLHRSVTVYLPVSAVTSSFSPLNRPSKASEVVGGSPTGRWTYAVRIPIACAPRRSQA